MEMVNKEIYIFAGIYAFILKIRLRDNQLLESKISNNKEC